MTGLSRIVLKVASRCNLNCDYCYVYQSIDQSWKQQPLFMSEETVSLTAQKVAAHHLVSPSSLAWDITLHGGEPLLYGKERLAFLANTFNSILTPLSIPYRIGIQTNGFLLDQSWIDLLYDLRIRIGLSIDGPPQYHDSHRVDHTGFKTHSKVLESLNLLLLTAKGKSIFSGITAVINLDCPAHRLYTYFRGLGVKHMQFLLPDGNYTFPPPRFNSHEPVFGQYLCDLFDSYISEGNPQVHISFFDSAIRLIMGYQIAGGSEYWGLEPAQIAVIESNGSIELPDYLKICKAGITNTNLNIESATLQEFLDLPVSKDLNAKLKNLALPCQMCQWKSVCGGGLISHRYSCASDFDNPSIYCSDIKYLLEHLTLASSLLYASQTD